jgi:outer membrane protein assembly factor BamB
MVCCTPQPGASPLSHITRRWAVYLLPSCGLQRGLAPLFFLLVGSAWGACGPTDSSLDDEGRGDVDADLVGGADGNEDRDVEVSEDPRSEERDALVDGMEPDVREDLNDAPPNDVVFDETTPSDTSQDIVFADGSPDDLVDEVSDPGDVDASDAAEDVDAVFEDAPDTEVPPPWEPRYPPSLTPLGGEPVRGLLGAFGAPAAGPPNAEGARVLYFGTGLEVSEIAGRLLGAVQAVDGGANVLLWSTRVAGEIYSTPRLLFDASDEPAARVFAGGRGGAFVCVDLSDGTPVWTAATNDYAATLEPYNFYTPAVVPPGSVTDEAVLLQVYGGDPSRAPDDPRDPGWFVLVRPDDGSVLGVVPTPDGAESYASPILLPLADEGPQRAVFGTGGETHGGGLWLAEVASILDGSFNESAIPLVTDPDKGFIGPVSLADLDGDGLLDIVASGMNGTTYVFRGSDGSILWQTTVDGAESFNAPAIAVGEDGAPVVFVQHQMGVFPNYTGTEQRVLDGRTGTVRWTRVSDAYYGPPAVAVDLRGTGTDVVLFPEMRITGPRTVRSRLVFLDLSTGETWESDDVAEAFQATPLVVDATGDGRLELVVLSSMHSIFGSETGGGTPQWTLHRWSLDAPVPPRVTWGGYLGTNTDGLAHLPPTEPARTALRERRVP